jgi:hypothetical protein
MSFLKNKKFLTNIVGVVLFFIFFMPVSSNAGLIKCGIGSNVISDGIEGGGCDFTDLIALINDIITWIINIASVIFAISFIYAGFLYLTAGEKPANKEKAKSMLLSTLVGFVIILVSWLIVYTILNILVPAGTGSDSIFNFIGGR